MAGWERRGYVSDSEAEEEELSDKTDSQNCTSQTSPHPLKEHFDHHDDAEGEAHELDQGPDDALRLDHQQSQATDVNGKNKEYCIRDLNAKAPLGTVWDFPSSSQATDELQDDHHEIQSSLRVRSVNAAQSNAENLNQGAVTLGQRPSSSPLTLPALSPTYQSMTPSQQLRTDAKDDNSISHTADGQVRDLPSQQQQQQGTLIHSHEDTVRQSRSLRHRNPIQLHPYAIEDEKYRRTLRGSGLRPLRIARGESQAAGLLDDSQAREFHADTNTQKDLPDAQSPQSSSSLAAPLQPSNSEFRYVFEDFDADQADLPDLESILRRMPPDAVSNGNKRRRVVHSARRKVQKQSHQEERCSSKQSHTPGIDDADTVFGIPPSPPQSPSPNPTSASRLLGKGFRMPRGVSPIALPTPVTSSEPRQPPRLVSQQSHSDDHSSMSESPESDSESLRSPPEDGKQQLRGIQRKIKGVLPASWLKLDLRTQARKVDPQTRRYESLSPDKDVAQQRGVARPVPARERARQSLRDPIVTLDSSSESRSDNEHMGIPTERGSSLDSLEQPAISIDSDNEDLPLPRDLLGEVAEDNRVDAMLPPNFRRKGYGRGHRVPTSKKKQIRLTDWRASRRHTGIQKIGSQEQPRGFNKRSLDKGSDRSARPQFQAPDLSILDVPSLGISSTGLAPSFIRLAQRISRSRKDRGKSNSNLKYLRLMTESETDEVNAALRLWRQGTLEPRVAQAPELTSRKRIRSPLKPCTGNQRITPGKTSCLVQFSDCVSQGEEKTRSTSHRTKSSKFRGIQSSLDNIVRIATRDRQRAYPQPSDPSGERIGTDKHTKRLSRTGHLSSSLIESGQARPATLESLQAHVDRNHAQSNFHRRLAGPNHHITSFNPLLAKFFDHPDILPDTSFVHGQLGKSPAAAAKSHPAKPRGSRKREPRRLQIQPPISPDANISTNDPDSQSQTLHLETDGRRQSALIGLGPVGNTYTASFDITPLPVGTCFSGRTFVGSGDFARSFIASDLDHVRGSPVFEYGHATFRWGPWDDHVSTQLGVLVDETCQRFQQPFQQSHRASDSIMEDTVELLKRIIGYLSTSLSFHDMVDRTAFLQSCKSLPLKFTEALTANHDEQTIPMTQKLKPLRTEALSLCLVFSSQLLQVSNHHVVSQTLRHELGSILKDIAAQALKFALHHDLSSFTQRTRSMCQLSSTCVTLDESYASAQILVIASHVLSTDDSATNLWQVLHHTLLAISLESSNDVRSLETFWERLFTILPFLEFDRHGLLEVGRRLRKATENWSYVKRLLEPVFEAYKWKTDGQAPNINTYCRTLFSRCLQLINVWGWYRCESIIGTLFDFFAQRSLFHLPNEDSHGSPHFLSNLDQKHILQSAHEDRCFHILLKVMASGVQHMQKIYSGKRIRDIVWRLMPNHGRLLPKDQAIQQIDLDALRNHHDLLCTLYWASPPDYRPRPAVIQALVDVDNSHKEACRINIRTWSNLMTFQLTAGEPSTNLEPFTNWYKDLLRQILQQRQNARTELEEQARSAQSNEGLLVSASLLESTIAQNQRQVDAILGDVLLSMKNAISIAPDLETAQMLLPRDLSAAFALFQAQSPRISKVIVDALEILATFAEKASPQHPTVASNNGDDSQDYGDWTAFDAEVVPNSSMSATAQYLEDHFQASLRKLLSNCLGADTPPEDTLLAKVIDVWLAVGRVLTRGGIRAWTDYIEGYGQDSWASLRDTEQTHRFSAYYLASLIETDKDVFEEHRQTLLKAWASSLVEREILLKYQHRLTNAFLNTHSDDPMLANPPFWTIDGLFQITPAEFSERRLSLVSNMLSNMRKSVQQCPIGRGCSEATNLKGDYKEILKVMMNSMKSNFQQMGQGSDIRGAYVKFVHRVVELLQQYTSSICPIDRFFTESSSFPLPAADPQYVVGQLKNYGMRLQDHRTPKQLSVFIQSVSERAALDGQQTHLIDQLVSVMIVHVGRDTLPGLELRSFLITTIFPAYVDAALSTSCGWIMSLPILQALRRVLSLIMTDVNGFDEARVTCISTTVSIVLTDFLESLHYVLGHPRILEQPKKLKTIASFFGTITAVLPALDYLSRVTRDCQGARSTMKFFKSFALFVAQSLLGQPDVKLPDANDLDEGVMATQHLDVRAFARQELRETLNKNWICHEEHYYVNRGLVRREVVVDVGLFEEEKLALIKELEHFFNALDRMEILRVGLIES
ncbi:MAG: hypothetical protein Q9216_004553 [Gyalolechia sp. 2 TL-2023]